MHFFCLDVHKMSGLLIQIFKKLSLKVIIEPGVHVIEKNPKKQTLRAVTGTNWLHLSKQITNKSMCVHILVYFPIISDRKLKFC